MEKNVNNNREVKDALVETPVPEKEATFVLDDRKWEQKDFCELQPHPLSKIFSMGTEEVSGLAEDIQENGLKEHIILYEEKILDGNARHSVCCQLIKEGKLSGVIHCRTLAKGIDPLQFLVSSNLLRRHLNESQRALIGIKVIAKMKIHCPSGRTDEKVEQLFNVSKRQAVSAKSVLVNGHDTLIQMVADGKIRINRALAFIEVCKQGKDAEAGKKRQEEIFSRAENAATEKWNNWVANDGANQSDEQKAAEKSELIKTEQAVGVATVIAQEERFDILFLVKVNGVLSISAEVVSNKPTHEEGILLHRCNSRKEAEKYLEEHATEINEMVARAKERFSPIYEAMKQMATVTEEVPPAEEISPEKPLTVEEAKEESPLPSSAGKSEGQAVA